MQLPSPPPSHRTVFRGRIYSSKSPLTLPQGHRALAVPVVCGGGGDGGVQVKQRKYLVKVKEDPKQVLDKVSVARNQWTACSCSALSFEWPLSFCKLGFIFNKEAIIERVLSRELEARFEHIRGLKDLRDLHATPNPGFDRSLGAAAEKQRSAFVCPVSGLDASGFIQFVGLWTCGHMMSKKALDATADEAHASVAVATTSSVAADSADQGDAKLPGGGSCPVCAVVFSAADVVPILPSEADRETRRRELAALRKPSKSDKSHRDKRQREEHVTSVVSQAKHISEEGLKSHIESKKKDAAFASIFSKSTGILGHSEGAHWGGAQGYRDESAKRDVYVPKGSDLEKYVQGHKADK